MTRAGRALLSLFVLAACDGGPADPEPELVMAMRAVAQWTAQHPHGWELDLVGNDVMRRPGWSQLCAANPPSGFTVLRFAGPGTEIDFHFRCPLDMAPSMGELAVSFSHGVLQELPHGIRSRGWRFRVLTPGSSIREMVTFTTATPGRMRIEIETPLYAVYGHSERPACQPDAGAPSPRACHLLWEHPIPLKLTVSVPFEGSLPP